MHQGRIQLNWMLLATWLCPSQHQYNHTLIEHPLLKNKNFEWINSQESESSRLLDISLIGCLYKVISKVLAIRLKKVLGKVIDERQCAFVGRRNLLDGVLIANEVVNDVRRRKKDCLLFKVDCEKAYDSTNWEFLYYMMKRLGFCEK